MNDDDKKLIAEARKYGPESMSSQLIRKLADALEAKHQEADEWAARWEKAANGVLALQAERDTLRKQIEGHGGWDEWIAEHMRVDEENDALRAKILLARGLLIAVHCGQEDHDDALEVLSRDIDTKENGNV